MAQDTISPSGTSSDSQLWLDYNFAKIAKKSRLIDHQVGYRQANPDIYRKLFGVSTLGLKNHKSMAPNVLKKPFIDAYYLGAGGFFTQNYDSSDDFEFRTFQGLKFDIPTIKQLTFYNYARIEERFQYHFDDKEWSAGFRLRYEVSIELHSPFHLVNFTQGFYFPFHAEAFMNMKKSERYNDVLRLSPGVGYQLKKDWRLELYLIYNLSKDNIGDATTSNDFIMRIRLKNGTPRRSFWNKNDPNNNDETD